MTATVCVHGLGYIGLPTAAVLARQGFNVVGYDTDPEVRERITERELEFQEIGIESLVEKTLDAGQLTVTESVHTADFHIICVPTPLDDERNPDLSYLEAAATEIRSVLREDDIVITESTVPPGTSTDFLRPILEAESQELEAGDTFGLVYCPETVLPGNILTELRENDRVIGGSNPAYCNRAVELYRSFCNGELYQTDLTSAEFIKLIQNSYRDLNVAFANQVATMAGEYDVASREVITLANTHPRVDILSPGPGVGGHCLPIDPWFLIDGSSETSLIETARHVNDEMPDYVVSLVEEALGDLAEQKIAILGVAYKGNVSDTRNSPALSIAETLRAATDTGDDAPTVALTDPFKASDLYRIQDLDVALEDADCAVIVTDHDDYADLQPEEVGERMAQRHIVDTRGILNHDEWEDSGFTVDSL